MESVKSKPPSPLITGKTEPGGSGETPASGNAFSKLMGRLLQRDCSPGVTEDEVCEPVKTTQNNDYGEGFIGVPLEDLPESLFTNGVPTLIWCCGCQVVKKIKAEGLFRIPAGTSDRRNLMSIAKRHHWYISEEVMAEYGVHCACSIIGQFVRSLPEPLFQFDLYDEWLSLSEGFSIMGVAEDESVLDKMRELLKRIPPRPFVFLRWFMDLLSMVADASEFNRMNSKNLGLVVGPSLLKPREEDIASIAAVNKHQKVLSGMITNYKKLFDGLPPQPAILLSNQENPYPKNPYRSRPKLTLDLTLEDKSIVWMSPVKPKKRASLSSIQSSLVLSSASEGKVYSFLDSRVGKTASDSSPPQEPAPESLSDTLTLDLDYKCGFGCGLYGDDDSDDLLDNKTNMLETLESAMDAYDAKMKESQPLPQS